MIWILAALLLGYALGAGAAWYALCERKKKRAGGGKDASFEDMASQMDIPMRLKKQYDNFFSYDGTGRGQVNIEDE